MNILELMRTAKMGDHVKMRKNAYSKTECQIFSKDLVVGGRFVPPRDHILKLFELPFSGKELTEVESLKTIAEADYEIVKHKYRLKHNFIKSRNGDSAFLVRDKNIDELRLLGGVNQGDEIYQIEFTDEEIRQMEEEHETSFSDFELMGVEE